MTKKKRPYDADPEPTRCKGCARTRLAALMYRLRSGTIGMSRFTCSFLANNSGG